MASTLTSRPAGAAPAVVRGGRSGSPGPVLQLTTVAEAGARIARARTVEEVVLAVTREARWLLSYDRCTLAVTVPGEEGPRLYSPARGGGVSASPYLCGSGLVVRVLERGQPLRAGERDPWWLPYEADEGALVPDGRSVLMLPLVADDQVLGTLNFSSLRPDAYDQGALGVGRLLALQVAGAVRNALLLEELDDRENVILSLALAIEAKDPYTEGHCQRLAHYAARLAGVTGLSDAHIAQLRMAAILHDVGKIAIPGRILGKPGKLTDEEYEVLKEHPVIGEGICRPLRSARALLPAIRHHHERWDGRGYPDGLAAEQIPLDARIIAIVDAFDAMTSDRPYRSGMPVERALAIMRENSGPQWDPELLAAFIPLIEADQGALARTAALS